MYPGLFDMSHGLCHGHVSAQAHILGRHDTACAVVRVVQKFIDLDPVIR